MTDYSDIQPGSGILERLVSRDYAVPLFCIALLVGAFFAELNHYEELRLRDVPWMFGTLFAVQMLYLWVVREPSSWFAKILRPKGLLTPVAVTMLASIAIVAGLAVSLHELPESAEYLTERGMRHSVHLVDGSTIDLNTESLIKVTYTPSARRVDLLQGEAFFSVAHDTDRPFEVRVSSTTIEDLGTEFDVRLRGNASIEITVDKGAVALIPNSGVHCDALERRNKGYVLDARLTARISTSGCTVQPIDSQRIGRKFAWKQGQLIFYKETLQEAAEEFNRYNRAQLVVDADIAGERVGGIFTATDVNSFVAALEQAGVADATRFGPERQPGASSEKPPTIIRLTRAYRHF